MDEVKQVLSQSHTRKRHYAAFLLFVAVFAVLFWIGYSPWKQRQTRIYAASVHPELPVVNVVKVTRAAPRVELRLPGTLVALTESSIYARAEGYIKSRLVDIGDHVKAGQLLAEIDTPELDEQYRQTQYRYNQFMAASGATKAALVQAEANLKLADVNLQRTEKLVTQGIFSRQELDDKKAMYDVRAAEVASAQANVKAADEGKRAVNSDIERLKAQTAFQKVTAPYNGIITARNGEVGNLINAAAIASGRELFKIADPTKLAVLIYVPQTDAPSIRAGMPAALGVAEFPGRTFNGSVERTANALDAANRTLLTKVIIDNPSGVLMPGMFGEVRLTAARTAAPLMVPGDTTIVRSDGVMVATVEQGRVSMKKLTLGRDLGREIEVTSGLSGDEMLIVNPGDQIHEGVQVTIAEDHSVQAH